MKKKVEFLIITIIVILVINIAGTITSLNEAGISIVSIMFPFSALSILVLYYYVKRSLLDPVVHLTNAIEEISNGNFDVVIDVDANPSNEIGRLESAMKRIVVTMKLAVKKPKA